MSIWFDSIRQGGQQMCVLSKSIRFLNRCDSTKYLWNFLAIHSFFHPVPWKCACACTYMNKSEWDSRTGRVCRFWCVGFVFFRSRTIDYDFRLCRQFVLLHSNRVDSNRTESNRVNLILILIVIVNVNVIVMMCDL